MIAPEIRADVGPLLDDLAANGYRVVSSEYSAESFGDWVVELAGPASFRLIKDRSQYMVDADRRSLEQAGLWRAYDDRGEFARRVVAWATR